MVKPIEQLKRGCFALLAWHNETACGRHVYTPSSVSRREWERRKKWEGRQDTQRRWDTREGGRNDDKSVYIDREREQTGKRWDTERRLKETEEEESDK